MDGVGRWHVYTGFGAVQAILLQHQENRKGFMIEAKDNNKSSAVMMNLRAAISHNISTVGYGSVNVSVNMAAVGLQTFDKCHFEYSYDKGSTYVLLRSLTLNENDKGFVSDQFSLPQIAENNKNLLIRYRVDGRRSESYCLVGTTTLVATPKIFTMTSMPRPVMETDYDTLNGSGNVMRKHLTFEELFSDHQILLEPIDLSAFAVPINASNPTNCFYGPLGNNFLFDIK
jgi:hypothetical protein